MPIRVTVSSDIKLKAIKCVNKEIVSVITTFGFMVMIFESELVRNLDPLRDEAAPPPLLMYMIPDVNCKLQLIELFSISISLILGLIRVFKLGNLLF